MTHSRGLSAWDRFVKRSFDLVGSGVGLLLTGWLLPLVWLAATIDTGRNGLFVQERIGMNGKPFPLLKIRTMRKRTGRNTPVTTANDPRITRLGRFLRRTKLDELPQLVNVLVGHMSFVGPRPDVPGFADHLQGEDRIVLSVRPGITGPATLVFRDEEELLASKTDPERYNREVLFPEKTRINKRYVENYRFRDDIRCILQTLGVGGDDGDSSWLSNHA